MTDSRTIQAGGWYMVDIEGARLRVKAVEEPPEMPGWWICETASGERVALPGTTLHETPK